MLSKGHRILDSPDERLAYVKEHVGPYIAGDEVTFYSGYYVDDSSWLEIFECYPEYQYTEYDNRFGAWGSLAFPSHFFRVFKVIGIIEP